jgi:hypothetical protein
VPDVIAHPGLPLDDLGDAPQGPHLASEPVRAGTLVERRGQAFQVGGRQSGPDTVGSFAVQRLGAASGPGGMPAAGALLGHPELAGDLGSTYPLGEQVGRLQAAGLAVGPLGGRANTGGRRVGATDQGRHARILPYRSCLRQVPGKSPPGPKPFSGSLLSLG